MPTSAMAAPPVGRWIFPGAQRNWIPISFVRCATEYAITPWVPIAVSNGGAGKIERRRVERGARVNAMIVGEMDTGNTRRRASSLRMGGKVRRIQNASDDQS